MARLPLMDRHASDQGPLCTSPVLSPVSSPVRSLVSSPVRSPHNSSMSSSILSTSPMRGNQFRLQQTASGTNTTPILGTCPWPREQCYLQAVSNEIPIAGSAPVASLSPVAGTSPMAAASSIPGTGQILRTSPQNSREAVLLFMPSDQRVCVASLVAHSPVRNMNFSLEQCASQSAAESDAGRANSAEAPDESAAQEASQYLVKNTFIDTPLRRSPSLERFFGERKIHSSPPSVVMDLNQSNNPFQISTPTGSSVGGSDVGKWHQDDSLFLPCNQKDKSGRDSDIGESTTASGIDPLASASGSGCISSMPGSGQIPNATGSSYIPDGSRPELLGNEPVIGSAEMPSRGSALHRFGACKPCAFVSHGVCRNDINCEFCHLCERGEKKRRRKEWLDGKRDVRLQDETVSSR